MDRWQLRQREKVLARAESIRSSISNAVVEPLSQQIAELQSELQALSEAAGILARQSVEDAAPGNRRAGGAIQNTAAREAPVVFLHIPKTAGTTVTIWLRLLHGARYSKAASYSTEPEKVRTLATALQERPDSVEVVAGHLPYSTRSLFPTQSRFFTFLRDPIDRSMSHFYYFRERELKDDPSAPSQATTQGISLEEALATWDAASAESQTLLPDNLQTRMLSGLDLDAPASREMFEAAKRNLRELDVVGLSERFHESVSLLHRVYGWKLLAIPSRRVRTHQRPSVGALEPGVLDGLRRLNALDEELYAEGIRHLEAAMAPFGETLLRDVEALRLARKFDVSPEHGGLTHDAVELRAAEILTDTATALDEDLPEQAHGLAMTLASHTTQLSNAVGSHVRQITQLTREITELVKKQQSRM